MEKILSELLDDGYGGTLNENSKILGAGLWKFEQNKQKIMIFENGFIHSENNLPIEIKYIEIVGIRSGMTMEKLSLAQRKCIDSLIMRFECYKGVYDLLFPFVIYSTLLQYFCEQSQKSSLKKIQTGFL